VSKDLIPTDIRLPALSYGVSGPVRSADDPSPELRLGVIVSLVFFVGFLGWAAFAPMDAAAYGEGQVSVEGHRQTVQHREGGVVGELLVAEGQKVVKDQVLLRLAAADVRAQERSLASEVIGLRAQRARLQAEQLRAPIVWPVEFATLKEIDRPEAERAMRVQTQQYGARRDTLSTQGGVLGQRSNQLNEQIAGFEEQIRSVDEQKRLLQDELTGVRSLNEKGYAPMTQVRALERALAQLDGRRAELQAGIAQSRERIGETRLQNVELSKTQQEQIAQELRDVEFALNSALPRWQAAQDQLARIEIRAPSEGTVVGLSVFTIGGVITPGQKVLDIVPDKAPMVLQTRFSPNDADDLAIGQNIEVRFSGLPQRKLPRIHGRLSKVSADSFTDERTGATYFQGEVQVPVEEVDKMRASLGADFVLKAGMPVQVIAPLKKRTALQYILEPLTGAVWRSFREQ